MSDNILTANTILRDVVVSKLIASCDAKGDAVSYFERLDRETLNILNKLWDLQAQEATNAR